VVDWYKQERGIILKDYARTMTPQEFLENPLFENYAWRTGFRELRSDEKLEKGDVLLMSILHPTLNHVAIFLGDMVLHHLADRLSCREPYSEWLLKCTGKRYRYAQKS
jgi:cell wall-associated NlpC family hydrolase